MAMYANGKVYMLCSNADDKIYVGSTCSRLSDRKSEHKKASKKHPDRYVYAHFNQIGWDDVEIIRLEAYPCEDKDALHARERHWYDQLKPELNMLRPMITDEENKQLNREYQQRPEVKQARREYRQRPEVKEREREYRQRPEVKQARREWRQRPEVKQAEHEYYQRQEYKQRRSEKIQCECGATVRRSGLSRHKQTRRHERLMATLNQPANQERE